MERGEAGRAAPAGTADAETPEAPAGGVGASAKAAERSSAMTGGRFVFLLCFATVGSFWGLSTVRADSAMGR